MRSGCVLDTAPTLEKRGSGKMTMGKAVRLKRIFRDNGKTVISALDFGGFMGPVQGLENPRRIVKKVVDAGADAVIVHPGFARETHDIYGGKAGLILRITGGCSRYSPDGSFHTMTSSVEEAVCMGADAVCVMVIIGAQREHQMLENLGHIIIDAGKYGMPVVAELLPDYEHSYDPEWVGVCARMGFEMGADVVKTYYCGPNYAEVIKNCPIPVVMAGGPKNTDIFNNIRNAMADGASGVAIGRNIFQADDPFEYTQKIISLVHG